MEETIEPTFIILYGPFSVPCFIICLALSCMPNNCPFAFTFIMLSQFSSSISMKNFGLFIPALSKQTLIEPKAFTVALIAAALSDRLVTSSLTAIAFPLPAEFMRFATSSAPAKFRSPKHTLAPCAA